MPVQEQEIKIVMRDPHELIPYVNNPRHNEAAVEAVARSLRAFGFKVPIVIDKHDVIVAGDTRQKAALREELPLVPCIVADDLTPEQIMAYRLADNKVAELAEWDYKKLELELDALAALDIDMSMLGFDGETSSFIDDLLKEEFAFTADSEHYSVTFLFDKCHKDEVISYIKAHGKEQLVELILEEVCADA